MERKKSENKVNEDGKEEMEQEAGMYFNRTPVSGYGGETGERAQ